MVKGNAGVGIMLRNHKRLTVIPSRDFIIKRHDILSITPIFKDEAHTVNIRDTANRVLHVRKDDYIKLGINRLDIINEIVQLTLMNLPDFKVIIGGIFPI